MNKIRRFVRFSAGGRWAHSLNAGLLCGAAIDGGRDIAFSFFPRHIAVVAIVPEQLLAFVGDVPGESRNPIQDGEDREIFL